MLSVFMLSVIMLCVIMLSVFMLSVIMLCVIMLSVIMLSVIMLSVIMLSVAAPYKGPICDTRHKCHSVTITTLCHYADCRYVGFHVLLIVVLNVITQVLWSPCQGQTL